MPYASSTCTQYTNRDVRPNSSSGPDVEARSGDRIQTHASQMPQRHQARERQEPRPRRRSRTRSREAGHRPERETRPPRRRAVERQLPVQPPLGGLVARVRDQRSDERADRHVRRPTETARTRPYDARHGCTPRAADAAASATTRCRDSGVSSEDDRGRQQQPPDAAAARAAPARQPRRARRVQGRGC